MIVVDTNVLAYLYLPTDLSTAADALLERDPDWAVPLLWRSEFRNILAGYLRRGTLTFEAVVSIQTEAEALVDGAEHEINSRTILELVRDSDCSANDCEFVALAQSLGVKLVTADKKLLKAFPGVAVGLRAG